MLYMFKHSLPYRPEIDGLRAIAVLPVVLFHAGIGPFKGGFVGVDIFFVLSGYLITSIILKDLAVNRFSLVQFYVRRARRILPALMMMLLICVPLAFWLMLPTELKRFGQSLMAVATFSSNIFFWLKTDYFAPTAEEQPLLHTWSLAVEEQYYLFFPVLLMIIWKQGIRNIVAVVSITTVGSLILASIAHDKVPQAAFYLLPTRAWELLIGSLVACIPRLAAATPFEMRAYTVGSMAGFVMILWALFTFDGHGETSPLRMLIPVLGTALVIHTADGKTWVGKLLSSRLCVGPGLISYSLYLWHQPVFAFGRLRYFDVSSPALMGVLVLLSILLGYASWRYVEVPTRTTKPPALTGPAPVLWRAGGLLSLTLLIGTVLHLSFGFSELARWKGIGDSLSVSAERASGERFCHAHPAANLLGTNTCVIGDPGARVDGVLWGDSLAGALLPGLHEELANRHRAFIAVLSDGCIPIEGAARTIKKEFDCHPRRHSTVVEKILQQESLKTVVWIGDFRLLTSGQQTDYVIDGNPATSTTVSARLLGTMKKLQTAGKDVVLVGNTPRFKMPVADYAMRMYVRNQSNPALQAQHVIRADLEKDFGDLPALLIQARTASHVVDGLSVFCNGQDCSSHDANGRPLYTDENHLSRDGARKLANVILN